MGDIPDVTQYLRSVPKSHDPNHKHNEHSIKFAMELEQKRRENERLNIMIAETVATVTKKMRLQLGKMGDMSRNVVEVSEERSDNRRGYCIAL